MMYVVYLCSDKNIQVVDGYQRYGISGYANDEIKDLVKKSRVLSKEEIQEYILKWNKIYDANSEVRFFIYSTLIVVVISEVLCSSSLLSRILSINLVSFNSCSCTLTWSFSGISPTSTYPIYSIRTMALV